MREREKRSSEKAKCLRHSMTPAETLLWTRLRRTPGLHIRRQHPIGPFIVDFACVHARLVIEADGSVHETADNHARDQERTDYLSTQGWHLLRFTNADVFGNVDAVVARILEQAFRGSPPTA